MADEGSPQKLKEDTERRQHNDGDSEEVSYNRPLMYDRVNGRK